MKQENIDILENLKQHWHTLRDAGFIKGLNSKEKGDMLKVMREEFQPTANPDMWCGNCVAKFVKTLYTLYEKEKAKQELPTVIQATFPKHQNTHKNILNLVTEDFIFSIPAMQEMQKKEDVLFIFLSDMTEIARLAKLNFLTYDQFEEIKKTIPQEIDITIRQQDADQYAEENSTDLFRAFYVTLGLPIPTEEPVINLSVTSEHDIPVVDYVIYKKSFKETKQIMMKNKDCKFCTLEIPGSSKLPEHININGQSLNRICNALVKSLHGLITSDNKMMQIAEALNVKVYENI